MRAPPFENDNDATTATANKSLPMPSVSARERDQVERQNQNETAMRAIMLLLPLLTSCTATRYTYDVTQTYHAPVDSANKLHTRAIQGVAFDVVWERLISFFATSQIPIDTIEKVSGIVVAKRVVADRETAKLFARTGEVDTVANQILEELEPSQFAGSANPGIVRATGNVTWRQPTGVLVTKANTADYRLSITFNVFVKRFADSDHLEVAVNSSLVADETIALKSGTTGWFQEKASHPIDVILQDGRLQSSSVRPAPVSTGVFEQRILDACVPAQ